jgi:hypothetical protein
MEVGSHPFSISKIGGQWYITARASCNIHFRLSFVLTQSCGRDLREGLGQKGLIGRVSGIAEADWQSESLFNCSSIEYDVKVYYTRALCIISQ